MEACFNRRKSIKMYWLNKSKCDLKNWNYYYLIFLWNQNWKKNNNLKITFYIFYSVVEK